MLAALGGLGGAALGSAVTAMYARSQGWLVEVPVAALAAGAGAAARRRPPRRRLPAVRAARLDPAEAVRPS